MTGQTRICIFYSKTFFNIATLSTEGFYDSNSFVDKVYISNTEVKIRIIKQ